MKNKITLLLLMLLLTITSCAPDPIEPTKTCGTITNMGYDTDANKVNHFYVEIERIENSYETYEVSKSEFDKLLSTYLINSNNNVPTEGCIVTLKLIVTRTTY